MISIIEYGVGNLFSLRSSLEYLGFGSRLVSDEESLHNSDKIILPGVGAFGDAAGALVHSGLVSALLEEVRKGVPLLGICVGMQMLFEESFEYGHHEGLGILEGGIYPMQNDLTVLGFDYKVPQIGWNALKINDKSSPIVANTNGGDFMYFVHSYYAKCREEYVIAETEYGIRVPAVVGRGNVFGSQFHPEKSGEAGLKFLRAFCEM